jgi:hypothetical protein
MKGDFSRTTFRSGNHYSSVRIQQGRVLLDAEWNEQTDLAAHVDRTTTTDVLGRSGAPKSSGGSFEHFAVAIDGAGTDLLIAPGRIYVDGILCENEGVASYVAQGDHPGAALPATDGNHAVYLDVWERHVTAVDQHDGAFPSLLEPALQGTDTATRTRVVWQVKLAPIGSLSCSAFTPPGPPTGRLRAGEVASSDPLDDCLVPTGGGYRRLENQLYRVEVHEVGQDGPLVTWSRDNASVVSRVRAVDSATLTIEVEDDGRDDSLGFGAARWVELSDEERVLRGEAGALFEVASVTGTSVVVLNPENLPLGVGTNATLRRWDGRVALTAGTPVELESGVQVEVDAGTFEVGDYWTIPARTTTGRVEWPRDSSLTPVFEARHGTVHHYCLLAVLTFTQGTFGSVVDCRERFPSLTGIAATDVSYDPSRCDNLSGATTVQEAMDRLCSQGGEPDEKGIRVERLTLFDGTELSNDDLVDPEHLAHGIRVSCDGPLFQDSVRNEHGQPNPVCQVTLDLPWPMNRVEREEWGIDNFRIFGFVSVTIASQVDADNNEISWIPTNDPPAMSQMWLVNSLKDALARHTHGQVRRVLGRLTLRGNFIWGPDKTPGLHLDGDMFGAVFDGQVRTRLPSGNRRRGGDFEMWFWVGE